MDGDGRTSGCWLDWAHWWTETKTNKINGIEYLFYRLVPDFIIAANIFDFFVQCCAHWQLFPLVAKTTLPGRSFKCHSHKTGDRKHTPIHELIYCKDKQRQRKKEKNSLLLSTPNSLPLRMWCSRFFMPKGLRLIKLSDASSPTKVLHVLSFLLHRVVCVCPQLCVSVLGFPTRAVQAASQLSGHHLHDESYPEPEHVPKQSRLGAHVHGQIDHDFLNDKHT